MFTVNDQLIECVPNFSEGKDQYIIGSIADEIRNVADVKLMNIDIGADANRTVYTFAGKPQAVLEAAYQAIKKANELIDMRTHIGKHPRMGACDVCPLIPLQNISMEEVVELSKLLGKRIGELGVPVYLYEYSASTPERRNLADLRIGGYESISTKIHSDKWKPDFGAQKFNPKFGMMALGARKFLIAYNINLKTKDESIAKAIAKKIRLLRTKNDSSFESNQLQHVKAIGWLIEEFDCVQVSTNITDIDQTQIFYVHRLVEEIAKKEYNIEINGSELIGLVPKQALLDIRKCMFIKAPTDEDGLIDFAIDYLGLNAVKPFRKRDNIIEYNLGI